MSAADDRAADEGRQATLSDEEIETTGIGGQSPVADTGDDTGDATCLTAFSGSRSLTSAQRARPPASTATFGPSVPPLVIPLAA